MTQENTVIGPRAIVFAGPNGSGKSTLIGGFQAAQKLPDVYINADDIARTEFGNISDLRERNLLAARTAESRRRDALANGASFAFETVMSTPGRVALLDEARARGYQVELAFVATRDPHINIARVAARVAQNGHDVDPLKIIERYQRTLALLPSALDLSDYAYVFDNSDHNNGSEPVPPLLLGFKKDGLIDRVKLEGVSWFDERVLPVCNDRSMERSLIEGALLPRIGNFQSYAGTVELSSTNFVWLRHDDRTLTIHDRALIAPQAFMKGDRAAISYQYGADGKAVQVQAVDVVKTSSVRERFNNLVSNTRAALESAAFQQCGEKPANLIKEHHKEKAVSEPSLEQQIREQEGIARLSQVIPESSLNEPSREDKNTRVIQSEPEHQNDEPGMDN